MANYLASDIIKVYPTALRGGTDYTPGEEVYDPESRLGTEFNLTNAVNRLTVDGSFVIKKSGNTLEFSIHGYYFKITDVASLTSLFSTVIYANIRLEELAKEKYRLLSLVSFEDGTSINLDTENNGFVGVGFTDTDEGDDSNTFSLKILEKINGTWVVPETSLLRFNAEDIMIDSAKNDDATSLHNVIYKDNRGVVVEADEFIGHFTGDIDGDLNGNAKTATDSEYAEKIGSSTNHPAIGSTLKPVYVDSNGKIQASSSTVGSYNQPVYLKNGEVTSAFKIHVDTISPNTTSGFNEGDIWLQYLG